MFVNNTKKWKKVILVMSKRAIFIFAGVTIFFICFYIGFNFNREETGENDIIANTAKIKNTINNTIENETIEVSSKEEKTTPNTILVFKKYYKDCEHTISSMSNIEEKMINLTEEEIKERYPGWDVEKFSKQEVVLSKNLESFCGEHYILTEEDNYISVYILDEEGNKILKEKGNISAEYLPETDRISLRNGIAIYGTEALNKLLEDFES